MRLHYHHAAIYHFTGRINLTNTGWMQTDKCVECKKQISNVNKSNLISNLTCLISSCMAHMMSQFCSVTDRQQAVNAAKTKVSHKKLQYDCWALLSNPNDKIMAYPYLHLQTQTQSQHPCSLCTIHFQWKQGFSKD